LDEKSLGKKKKEKKYIFALSAKFSLESFVASHNMQFDLFFIIIYRYTPYRCHSIATKGEFFA
jgi:hypothetical protein